MARSLLFEIAADKVEERLQDVKHPWLLSCCLVPFLILLGVIGLGVVIGFIGLHF